MLPAFCSRCSRILNEASTPAELRSCAVTAWQPGILKLNLASTTKAGTSADTALHVTNPPRPDHTRPNKRRYGPNALTPAKKPGFFAKLWAQLNNVLIFILLAAAVVTAGLQEWIETGLILGVITINVAIGLVQEGKAEKAAEAIKAMLSSTGEWWLRIVCGLRWYGSLPGG